MSFKSEPVLHIIVIGFHHKRGCQVEHCYPQLAGENQRELPAAWRHLPALALPDGSHNYLSDTIFFHLPDLNDPSKTVYGISCFRQIPLEQVTQKTEDMTRSSVQKSVCVLCRIPLFSRLAVKMELVVRAWFLQGDFSQTTLLEDAYKHLNSCPIQLDQILEGLSVQKLVESWRHKALLLVKMLLLRRRVVVYGAQAGAVSATLLALVSLLPRCLEHGLGGSANILINGPITTAVDTSAIDLLDCTKDIGGLEISSKECADISEEKDNVSNESIDEAIIAEENLSESREEMVPSYAAKTQSNSQSPTISRDMSVDGLNNLTLHIDLNSCGFPLQLFGDGYLCLPYLSLQYLDVLCDPSVTGFLVGASNVLFKQKRQLFDVLVDLDEMRIEASDLVLRRQLALSTEDLRFADHVVRHASVQGDTWIRDQFASYLIYFLRSSLLPEGSRELDPYNPQFMSAFKQTPAYQAWLEHTNNGCVESFASLAPVHPFSGQLSVADMKLKFAHTMSSTEGGRKVSAAVASTGRAVGGALASARGAFSGWWSALTTPPTNATPPTDTTHDAPPDDQEDRNKVHVI